MLKTNHELSSRPTFPLHQRICEVKINDPVNSQYRYLVVSAPDALLDCVPGQFFHLLCEPEGGDQPFFRRPMSIYGFDRDRGELSFLYKVTGAGTRSLASLRAGDGLDVVGPLGVGFTLPKDMTHPLLVARGVGLATLAPLARAFRQRGVTTTAICSARSADLLMSVELFETLGVRVIPVTDADGNSGMEAIKALIERLITEEKVDGLYTCGSKRLTTLLKGVSASHGIFGEVALEQHMACGVGVCQACVLPFSRDGITQDLRVCRDGPVFNLAEVL